MVAKRFAVALVVAITVLAMTSIGSAQSLGMFAGTTEKGCGAWCDPGSQGFWMALGIRKYINSFTSEEAPANAAIGSGKTRVEWPWDQPYGVVKLGYNRGCVGLIFDYSASIDSMAGIKAQETYWDPGTGAVVLFGKGKGKPRGQMIDVAATWCLPIMEANTCEEPTVKVFAVAGYRNQRYGFSLTSATDRAAGEDPVTFPGVDVEFAQYYNHWYIGGILAKRFEVGSLLSGITGGSASCGGERAFPFMVTFQADYAWVKGNNNWFDFIHGARANGGTWIGGVQSKGHCWHLNLTLATTVSCNMMFAVEGDFKRIDARGSQDFYALGVADPAVSWDGAKTWSDQQYIGVLGTYSF